MLDLETLSVRPNAVILIIGAVKFSRAGSLKPLKKMDVFYRRIELDSCAELGMRVDKATVDWWKQQDEKVYYEALENPDRVPIRQALEEFSIWMRGCKKIWGNGDDFDCTILGEAYDLCAIEKPWNFWDTRDVRTLFDLAGVRKCDLPTDNEHHAVYDCYRQIVGVKRAFKKLRM